MTAPEMILFDFGQTIMDESFDGLAGTKAVMEHAAANPLGYTPEQVQQYADTLTEELGLIRAGSEMTPPIEIPNSMFQPYLYESLGIEIGLTPAERDRIFWDAAAPGHPTEGIREFLTFLKEKGIRTGIISNICYDPEAVKARVREIVPENHFEFVICSSNYLFRKPSRRIFELALTKAGLQADQAWYVGDNYGCDVQGSSAAGMTPVWYKGALRKPSTVSDETVLAVESWSELQRIVENLKQV